MLIVAVVVFVIFVSTILTAAIGCLKVAGWPLTWHDYVELVRSATGLAFFATFMVVSVLNGASA